MIVGKPYDCLGDIVDDVILHHKGFAIKSKNGDTTICGWRMIERMPVGALLKKLNKRELLRLV